MFCAECGKSIPEGARFCQECGAPATGTRTAATPPPVAPAAAPYYSPQGPTYPPAGPPPRRRHEGLIPGVIAAVIILLAGLGVGLFFGLRGDSGDSVSTTVTDVAVSTTVPPTTLPPTTATTLPETTTSESTASTEMTTTTESQGAILEARVAEWMRLLESIPTSSKDLTSEVAALLTPQDQAQDRAIELVEWWSEGSDPESIIESDPFSHVVGTAFAPDGFNAMALAALDLNCRDGLTTRGLTALSWQLEDTEWKRTCDYVPMDPVDGSVTPLGGSVYAGDLLWCPDLLQELKHLSANEGPTAPGMFMTVEFCVWNRGTVAMAPVSYQVSALDASGKRYGLSQTADEWWDLDVEDRKVKIAPGDVAYLWYTFEIPEGADLQKFQYEVLLPGI